jgi:rod shape-determining protein MreC
MIAVTEKGLVGKISEVSGSYSYLLLLSDINFSAAVRIQESRIEGVVSGTGFRKCQLKYIPYEEEVKKNSIIITSGLDQLLPRGIPVGYVSKVNKKDIGFFQEIEVLPFVDLSKIEAVSIIHRE